MSMTEIVCNVRVIIYALHVSFYTSLQLCIHMRIDKINGRINEPELMSKPHERFGAFPIETVWSARRNNFRDIHASFHTLFSFQYIKLKHGCVILFTCSLNSLYIIILSVWNFLKLYFSFFSLYFYL